MKIISLKKWLAYFLEAIKGEEREYTTGSISKAIFMLSVPVIIEMIGEALFAVIDIAFVSRVSVNAIATVGLTESVMFIIYSIAIGLSMAASAVVARRVGEKNLKDAAKTAQQAMIIALFVGTVLGIVGYIYSADILRFMGGSDELINEGNGYAKVIYMGNLIIMLLFLINGIFRGAGNTALAMKSLLIANGINLILDPIFIFGIGSFEGWGVTGAAIATTLGRGIGVLFQLYILFTGKSMLKMLRKNFVPCFNTIKQLLKISIGGIGQFFVESASWIVLIKLVALFGSSAVAGYTIGVRIIMFTLLPSWGLAQAAAALVGQNLGAKLSERAEKSVWRTAWFNMYLLLSLSIVFFIIAEPLISLFFTKNTDVIQYAANTLKISCLGYVFFAFGMVISQAFNGAGDTKTPTIINIICFWIVQIPLAYIAVYYFEFGLIGVLFSISFTHTIHALLSIILFKRGKWKLTVV